MKEILFVLLEEYADWEAASIAAALNQQAEWVVKTVSNEKYVRSIGGFTTVTDYTLEEAVQKEFAAVILIGGTSWRTAATDGVAALVKKAEQENVVIAAICDATVYLSTLGLLNNVKHTSNQVTELTAYAGAKYTGANNYLEVQAVRDQQIITANGTAHLEFAREILSELQVMSEKDIEQWYNFYKLGYYDAIKQALRQGEAD